MEPAAERMSMYITRIDTAQAPLQRATVVFLGTLRPYMIIAHPRRYAPPGILVAIIICHVKGPLAGTEYAKLGARPSVRGGWGGPGY